MSFDSTQPPAPQHDQGVAGPPAAPDAQTEKRKKPIFKRWWLWAIIVVIIAIAWPKGGGSDAPASDPASSDQAASEQDEQAAEPPADEEEAPADEVPAVTPIGTAAEIGSLSITVTQVEPGVPQVGEEIGGTLLGEKAQGQFVLIHVSVENVGTEAESFSDMNAKVYDAQDREFEANSAAGIYIDGNDSLFGEINPGNTLQGVLVFDIPADASAERLEYKGVLDFLADPAVFALK
ncbi:DUF4352 domain-containing protein [Microbacterium rhizophilus]|uniref:DUF4352 domain-containing protein n=1 Tax=Microbacterium rhizophilus TaxID=3138934 RepID=UPI0031EFE647